MASGMDMMMEKMLGINPKQIQEQAQEMAERMHAIVNDLRNQLNRIEMNQQVMYQLMVKSGVIDPIDTPMVTSTDEDKKDAAKIN